MTRRAINGTGSLETMIEVFDCSPRSTCAGADGSWSTQPSWCPVIIVSPVVNRPPSAKRPSNAVW
jgi:hypothetical protein